MTYPYPEGPLREAWRRGAQDEAKLRDAPRKSAPDDVRQLLDYADALVKYDSERAATTGQLLVAMTFVFRSTLSRADRRAIRRALKGRR